MPLFSGRNVGSKPHQLPASEHLSEKGGSGHAHSSQQERDIRGTVIKLPKHVVTLEKKLAEGGFAIVYLASDRRGHYFALKRQFISDDTRQLEACKRECKIIAALGCHRNIVTYVDHSITQCKSSGVYDYMLLTAFYRSSVLQLMNERLLSNRCLTVNEILSIFCDMCEAVARLHHSQTPVIHRDLKVENILIDERRREPPIYVLCDFGSATTKVLSTETHDRSFVEEEVQRYTTLSYRAPEMIDLYAGRPIGTKIDIWAMGIMLYKLCYFSLPFGESALAIQNGTFSFPADPAHMPELKVFIEYLLQKDIDARPDIYQTSCIAFQLASRRCPVPNLNKVPTPTVSQIMLKFRGTDGQTEIAASAAQANESPLVEPRSPVNRATTTSVNPRLRPKPLSSISRAADAVMSPNAAPLSAPIAPVQNSDANFTKAMEAGDKCDRKNATKNQSGNMPDNAATLQPSYQKHKRNASDTTAASALHSSAFKPYSTTGKVAISGSGSVTSTETITFPGSSNVEAHSGSDDAKALQLNDAASTWNPFIAAPFGDFSNLQLGSSDDHQSSFLNGRHGSMSSTCNVKSSESLIMAIHVADPFAAAPFDHAKFATRRTTEKTNTAALTTSPTHGCNREKQQQQFGVSEKCEVDSVGSSNDLRQRMENMSTADDDGDEGRIRMPPARRFSYEHFDSVGDDASSDSRHADDGDDTADDATKESLLYSRTRVSAARRKPAQRLHLRGSCTYAGSTGDDDDASSAIASSLTTDAGDDGVGNRPLLDDDELDEEHAADLVSSSTAQITHDIPQSSSGLSPNTGIATNPFLIDAKTVEIARETRQTARSPKMTQTDVKIFPGQPPLASIDDELSPLSPKSMKTPSSTASSVFLPNPREIAEQPSESASLRASNDASAAISAMQKARVNNSSSHNRAASFAGVGEKYQWAIANVPAIGQQLGRETNVQQQTENYFHLVQPNSLAIPPRMRNTALSEQSSLHSDTTDRLRDVPRLTATNISTHPAMNTARPIHVSPQPTTRTDERSVYTFKPADAFNASEDSNETDDSGAEMFGSSTSGSGKKQAGGASKKKKKWTGGSSSTASHRASSSSLHQPVDSSTKHHTKKNAGKRHASTSSKSSGLDQASFVNNSFQAEDIENARSTQRQQN